MLIYFSILPQRTGLGSWLGEQLLVIQVFPDWLVVFLLCFIINLLTELGSNTAIASFLMPIIYNMVSKYLNIYTHIHTYCIAF